jgi:hypothetical protein
VKYPQPHDWPTDEETERRMLPIMQNGNCGDHYKQVKDKADDPLPNMQE